MKDKPPSLEEALQGPPEFSVGITSDGGLHLAWLRTTKTLTLNAKEADLIATVLLGQGRVMRFLEGFST